MRVRYIERRPPAKQGGHIGMHTYTACMLPQLSYVVAAQACYGCLLSKAFVL